MTNKRKYECLECGNVFYESDYSLEFEIDQNPSCPKCESSYVQLSTLKDRKLKSKFLISIFIFILVLLYGLYFFVFHDLANTMWFISGVAAVLLVVMYVYDNFIK